MKKFAIAFTIAIAATCPTVASCPGYLTDTIPFCVKNPVITTQVITSGKLWCDSCGNPCKVQKLKIAKSGKIKGKLTCKKCRKYFKKHLDNH